MIHYEWQQGDEYYRLVEKDGEITIERRVETWEPALNVTAALYRGPWFVWCHSSHGTGASCATWKCHRTIEEARKEARGDWRIFKIKGDVVNGFAGERARLGEIVAEAPVLYTWAAEGIEKGKAVPSWFRCSDDLEYAKYQCSLLPRTVVYRIHGEMDADGFAFKATFGERVWPSKPLYTWAEYRPKKKGYPVPACFECTYDLAWAKEKAGKGYVYLVEGEMGADGFAAPGAKFGDLVCSGD